MCDKIILLRHTVFECYTQYASVYFFLGHPVHMKLFPLLYWKLSYIFPFCFTGFGLIYAQNSTEVDIQPYLLLANTFDIRRLNFDGTDYRFLIGSLSGTVAMDYDYTTGYLYWSHTREQTKIISRQVGHLDGRIKCKQK